MSNLAQIKADMIARDNAPVAKEVPFSQTVEVAAGAGESAQTHTLHDEYQWLRGATWPTKTVEDKDIIDHMNAENKYCKDFMAALDEQKTAFFETLKGRMKLSDTTLAKMEGNYWYYSRTEESLQYSIDCRTKIDPYTNACDAGAKAAGADSSNSLPGEEILLDRNVLAKDKKFAKILSATVSSDGNLMAYLSDFVGDENYCLRFEDKTTGKYLPEEMWHVARYAYHELPPTTGDNSAPKPPIGIFYVVRNEQLRPTKLWYHKFGTGVKEDKLLFSSKNDMFTVRVDRTSDLNFVVVKYRSKTETEGYAIDVRSADADVSKLKLLKGMEPDVEYSVDHGGGFWFMSTKAGCKKEHFRILRSGADISGVAEVTSDDDPHKAMADGKATRPELPDWSVNVEEDPELCLNGGVVLTKSYLSLEYLNTKTGQPKLVSRPIDANVGDAWQTIAFPNIDAEKTSHAATFSHTTNYDEDWIQVAVDTPCSPTIWYRYTYGTGADQMKLLKQKEVPNYDDSLYGTERFYAVYTEDAEEMLHKSVHEKEEAKNPGLKVSIPVTVFYKKSLFKKDGSVPLLLNGYGSYGISKEPSWSNLSTLYADLGFVVATAHIRGGADLGEPWYQAAKFLTKKRTFFDFIAAAEKLAEDGYTSKGNVAICGGSAGGMLVGTCLNQRPDLFRAVIAHVPFVTVLDTMLDGTLPLTPGEFKEWGNPRDPGYFQYIKSYCPYENVDVANQIPKLAEKGSKFPSIFATAGLTDYRVGYYEAAKWIARIRKQIKMAKEKAGNISEPMVILETNMNAGHAGASGRFDRLKEVARDVAFLASEFAIETDGKIKPIS